MRRRTCARAEMNSSRSGGCAGHVPDLRAAHAADFAPVPHTAVEFIPPRTIISGPGQDSWVECWPAGSPGTRPACRPRRSGSARARPPCPPKPGWRMEARVPRAGPVVPPCTPLRDGSGRAGYRSGVSRRPPRPFREPRPSGRRRGRFGMWGPIPYYSTRTRRGSEVSVGGCGCCLPIPLLAALGLFTFVRLVARELRRRPRVRHSRNGRCGPRTAGGRIGR
jgi:hypothetical protein